MKPIYNREIPDYCKIKFEQEMFNKKFGHLKVIGISNKTDSTNVHFCICLCDCGRIFHCRKRSIQIGRTKSCCNFASLDDEKKRFKEKVFVDTNECWIWLGSKYKRKNGKSSYGRFESKRFPNEYLAHRLSFLLYKDMIPKDMYVCHICDVESCVNPDHLFIGCPEANSKDMVMKGNAVSGDKNFNSKFTKEQVVKCREMYKEGIKPHAILKKFKISRTNFYRIINRELWKHI